MKKLKLFVLDVLRYLGIVNYTAKVCGHKTKVKYYSLCKTHSKKQKVEFGDHPDYCSNCLTSMSTICHKCKEPIMIGDLVYVKSYSMIENFNHKTIDEIYHQNTNCTQLSFNIITHGYLPDSNLKGTPTPISGGTQDPRMLKFF